MTTRISVETGSEYLLPFAKRKLAQLKEIGLQTCRVDASDGARIFIHNAEAISKGAVDTIRIMGGVRVYWGDSLGSSVEQTGDFAAPRYDYLRVSGGAPLVKNWPLTGADMIASLNRLVSARRWDVLWAICNTIAGNGSAYLCSGWEESGTGIGYLLVDNRYFEPIASYTYTRDGGGTFDIDLSAVFAPFMQQFEHAVPAELIPPDPQFSGSDPGWVAITSGGVPYNPGNFWSKYYFYLGPGPMGLTDHSSEVIIVERYETRTYQENLIYAEQGSPGLYTIATDDVTCAGTRYFYTRTKDGYTVTGSSAVSKAHVKDRTAVSTNTMGMIAYLDGSPDRTPASGYVTYDNTNEHTSPAALYCPGFGLQSTGSLGWKVSDGSVTGWMVSLIHPSPATAVSVSTGQTSMFQRKDSANVVITPPNHVVRSFLDPRTGYNFSVTSNGTFTIETAPGGSVIFTQLGRILPGSRQLGDMLMMYEHSETREYVDVRTFGAPNPVWKCTTTTVSSQHNVNDYRTTAYSTGVVTTPNIVFGLSLVPFAAVLYEPTTGGYDIVDWVDEDLSPDAYNDARVAYLLAPSPAGLQDALSNFSSVTSSGLNEDLRIGIDVNLPAAYLV